MAKIKVLEATESMQRLQAQLDEESSDDEAYQMTEQEDSVSHSQHVSPLKLKILIAYLPQLCQCAVNLLTA